MRERGFTLIELMIVIAIIAVMGATAIPQLIEARKSSNESAAIGSLRTIATAQEIFRDQDKDGNGVLDYAATLQDLFEHGDLVDDVLGSGTKQGYLFALEATENRLLRWAARASPIFFGLTAGRSFFIDETGIMREGVSLFAGPTDPPIGTSLDVAVDLFGAPAAVAGQPYTFTAVVGNLGGEPTPAALHVEGSPGVVFDSADVADPDVVCVNGSVNCTFPLLGPGVTVPVTITVTPTVLGPIDFDASVSAPGDVNLANNDAMLTATVEASVSGPDPAVRIEAPLTATVFQPLRITISVMNLGDQPAEFVTLGVGVPSSVTPTGPLPMNCTIAFEALICIYDLLPPGTVVVTFDVITSVTGPIVFDASLSVPPPGDINPTNNFTTFTATILP